MPRHRNCVTTGRRNGRAPTCTNVRGHAHDKRACTRTTRIRARLSELAGVTGDCRNRPLMLLYCDREFSIATELIISKKKKKESKILTPGNWGVTVNGTPGCWGITILIYNIFSHIHNNDNFSHIDIGVNCRCYGSHTSKSRLPIYLIYVLLIRRFGELCHHLSGLGLQSGIVQSESCVSLAFIRGYLRLAP